MGFHKWKQLSGNRCGFYNTVVQYSGVDKALAGFWPDGRPGVLWTVSY